MNDNFIVYRPFINTKYVLPFLVLGEIYSFVLLGFLLKTDISSSFFIFIIGVYLLILQLHCYSLSKITICFENNTIRSLGDRGRDLCVSWKTIYYVYHANNFKGHHYLILSPHRLNEQQIKNTRKRSLKEGICVRNGGIIIIPISSQKEILPLKEMIYAKAANGEIKLSKYSQNHVKF